MNLLGVMVFISIAVILRLFPHPANISPIAGMALLGGAYFNKRYALFAPLIALFISDMFLGFHQSMFAVYSSYFLIGCIGLYISKRLTPQTIIGASLFSSVLFFLVTNFNFWYIHSLYPKTLEGILESYRMALPFFRNTLIGDLLYTGLFFGLYIGVRRLFFRPLIVLQKEGM